MENKFPEDVKLVKTLSERAPPPLRVGNIVIRQPSEREIYEEEVEPYEQSVLLGYRSVKEYLYRKQYWEANDLDDMRLEEYELQEGKGVPKMERRCKWGRENGKGASKGRGYRTLSSVSGRTAPGAIMDKRV